MDKRQEILVVAIKRLESHESPGNDNVTGKMIKYGNEKLKRKEENT